MRTESYLLGIDVGGTSAKLGLFNSSEVRHGVPVEAVFTCRADTGPRSPKDVFEELGEQLRTHLGGDIYTKKITSIGVGMPGLSLEGTPVFNFNLPHWIDTNIVGLVRQVFGGEIITVANDVASHTAYAGHLYGEENEYLLCVAIGTGVAAGLWHRGSVLTLGLGMGEISQVSASSSGLQVDNPLLGWIGEEGGPAHVGDIISAEGIVNAYQHLAGESLEVTDAEKSVEVARRAELQDRNALATFEHFGVVLANAIATLRSFFNPRHLILSGGPSAALPFFSSSLERRLAEECFGAMSPAAKFYPMRIVAAPAQNGLLGAALLAAKKAKHPM